FYFSIYQQVVCTVQQHFKATNPAVLLFSRHVGKKGFVAQFWREENNLSVGYGRRITNIMNAHSLSFCQSISEHLIRFSMHYQFALGGKGGKRFQSLYSTA